MSMHVVRVPALHENVQNNRSVRLFCCKMGNQTGCKVQTKREGAASCHIWAENILMTIVIEFIVSVRNFHVIMEPAFSVLPLYMCHLTLFSWCNRLLTSTRIVDCNWKSNRKVTGSLHLTFFSLLNRYSLFQWKDAQLFAHLHESN